MSVKEWLLDYRLRLKYAVCETSINEMPHWYYQDGVLTRKDRAYFSVKAIRSNSNNLNYNETPIIHQPEIGILGFVICFSQSEWEILLQAKSEPGNIGITQIGPSVQATVSNYNSVHGGKKQPYIDFFTSENVEVLTKIKQSEQGTRFLNKYNFNSIVSVEKDQVLINDVDLKYRWVNFSNVLNLLNEDYIFNTDFKSVLSHLLEPYILNYKFKVHNPIIASYFNNVDISAVDELLKSIEIKRKNIFCEIEEVGLNTLKKWKISDSGITPIQERDFGFYGFDIFLEDREITHWYQPLVVKKSIEYIDLYACLINNEYHFVFRNRYEIGFKNHYQLGPTFQEDKLVKRNVDNEQVLISFKQSEEGGRFYQNISEYRILLKSSIEEYINNQDEYVVLNVFQICTLLKQEGIFTNESRSVISSLFTLV